MSVVRRVRRFNWSLITAMVIILMFVFQQSDIDSQLFICDSESNLLTLKRPVTVATVKHHVEVTSETGSNFTRYINEIFVARIKKIRDGCLLDTRGHVQRLMIYRPANLSYCIVPKAGCTFWKRIFRFLNGDMGSKTVASPFKINRMIAHYGAYKNMGSLTFKNISDRLAIANTHRILVARDPYSRLWAVYLDKFLLPDFWRTHGQVIHRQKHQLNFTINKSKTSIKHSMKNTSFVQQVCTNNISFEDFVRYVVSQESKGQVSNEHWIPINKLCNPCQYQPDYVSKMETFSQDATFILKQSGLQRVLKLQPRSRVHEELEMLIKYNFQLLGAKFYKRCISTLDLCKRLWKVFQMNGYLSVDAKFPELLEFKPSMISKELFLASVMKVIRAEKTKKKDKVKQKKDSMEAAYRGLQLSLLRMIPYVFEHDFRLFGYNPYPRGIYKDHRQYKQWTK